MKTDTAVILAAGQSKRFKSDIPKVLHKIQGKPVICYVVESLIGAGMKKIIVVVSKGNFNQVKEAIVSRYKNVKFSFVVQRKPLGTANALISALKDLKGKNFLVTTGDMPLISKLSYKKAVRKFESQKADCVLVSGIVENPFGYGRIIKSGKQVVAIREEKDLRDDEKSINEINSGIYVFKYERINEKIRKIRNKNHQKEFYLTDIISLFYDSGYKVLSVSIDKNELQGINTREDVARVYKILWDLKNRMLMKKGVTIEDPNTTFIDMNVEIGKDTIIKPFTIIETGTKIGKNCIIGPFSHIRNEAVIMDKAEIGNFVEVKKSRIGRFTKAKHLSYLGDAELGEKSNIGAGTITANYDGKNKFKTIIGNGCFIGSNTVLIAPLKLGNNVKTGAGAVVTKNQIIPSGSLLIGVPAKILN